MCNFAQTQRRDGTNDMSFHSPALVPSLPPKWALLRRQSPPPSASSPLATPSHLRTGRRQLPPRQRPTAGRSPAASARSPHPPQVGLELGDGGACGKLVSSASPPSLPPSSPARVILSPLTPAQRASPPGSILPRRSQMRLGVGKSKPATLRACDRAHRGRLSRCSVACVRAYTYACVCVRAADSPDGRRMIPRRSCGRYTRA